MTEAATIQSQMFAAVERGDAKVLRELCHSDYAYTGVDGVEHEGAEAGLAVAELYFTAFPDLTIEIVRSHSPTEDVAIAELRFSGTHTGPLDGIPPSGRRVQGTGCNVVEIREGRIWRERDYWDDLSLMRQIGAIAG